MPDPTPAQAPVPGDLNPELIGTDWWTDDMIARAGIPIVDVPFVSVGGGIGSLVMVDYLRIVGIPTSAIKVLTTLDKPWDSYEYLTRVSQIPRHERLRSDSASCPDNIWGFPSYAVREAFTAKSLGGFFKPLVQVVVEPIFNDYYTPQAGQAFVSMEKEAIRIGFAETVVHGQVRMVRRRQGGGYITILTPPIGASRTRRVAFRSRYVHLAVGYPGLRYLPDLQKYREETRDIASAVNAYESHEHIYDRLKARPGTVLVRGGGIVASRVLQRLIDDRDAYGLQTRIVHLFRTYITGSHGPSVFMRRQGGHGWAYQGFNFPKSIWGGVTKEQVRKSEGAQRAELYKVLGGTTTPKRRSWQKQLARGRHEGWYTTVIGEIDGLRPADSGGVLVRIKGQAGLFEAPVVGLIDCTGLEADVREHRVLADLLDHGGAVRNPVGRLDVEPFSRYAAPAAGRGGSTQPAAPRSVGTSRPSTPFSACSTPLWRSSTTWPGKGSVPRSASVAPSGSGGVGYVTGGRSDPPHVSPRPLGHRNLELLDPEVRLSCR